MDPSERGLIENWVQQLLERALTDISDGPHIVVARDPEDGSTYFTGPFASAIEACVAAEAETRLQRGCPERVCLQFSVAPIALP